MSTPDPLRTMIADIVRSEFAMLQRPAGPHTYRVAAIRADGRVDLKPQDKSRGVEDITNVDHWTGIAGGAALTVVGSVAMVEFADGDTTQPILVSYQPLRSAGVKPTRTTIDATTLQLGPTATAVQLAGSGPAVARVGDAIDGGYLTVAFAAGAVSIAWSPTGVPSPTTAHVTGTI